MKYPKLPVCLALMGAGLLSSAFAPRAEARIGESAQTIERRVYANGGIKYRDDDVLENRRKGIPYLQFMDYLPAGSKLSVYFKTHDGRKPKSSDMESARMHPGWDLHVIYVNGKSALELYKRSQAISEFEFNQLLVLQQGGGWMKVQPGPPAAGEEPPVSAFGFTMVSKDESVRAKKIGGDGVLFILSEMDIALAETKLESLQDSAPRSVMGF